MDISNQQDDPISTKKQFSILVGLDLTHFILLPEQIYPTYEPSLSVDNSKMFGPVTHDVIFSIQFCVVS